MHNLNLVKLQVQKIFPIFKAQNPHPTTELIYHNDFELLVAVILSAQATDISVNKATVNLFKVAGTPKLMVSLGVEGIISYIKSIGLYQTKAKNVFLTSQQLINKFNTKVPNNYEDLISLAGVGRKTANVILNTLFKKSVIAVDTHIFRLARRIGLSNGNTVFQVEDDLMQVIPKKYLLDAHHWLILHGRYICKAKKPLCASCIINKHCNYYQLEAKAGVVMDSL